MNNDPVSLPQVNGSVNAMEKSGFWKKLFVFLGPAYLISVGYMDPGNWATDIAGGSRFGYSLIWVLVLSNLIALLLQSLSARLGLVLGLDLAQASRASYSRPVNFALWFIAEIAIAACDLAEVLGMAIGLQLLFGIPLIYGVCLTVLDTFLLLFLLKHGMRKMEAFILALIAIIGLAFLFQVFIAKPDTGQILRGLIPSLSNRDALYISISIIGATVMPHNLYLHSSLVQTREIKRTHKGIRSAIRFNFYDTFIALNLALFVNIAILVLAAAAFFSHGLFGVEQIQDAHRLLAPILGHSLAPTVFAIALIAAGQSSTLTGTLSGQIVMEGYLNLRIQPWLRRIITRLVAIIPAFLVIWISGESETSSLLIFSQVILCLQLGFAIIPLVHLVSDKEKMGAFVIPLWMKVLAWISTGIILGLNIVLVYQFESGWIHSSSNPLLLQYTLVPFTLAVALFLTYLTFSPLIKKLSKARIGELHNHHAELVISDRKQYRKIAITVDFGTMDSEAISNAISQGGTEASYLLIHVVETAGARMFESEISDQETADDSGKLKDYQEAMLAKGYHTETKLGFGNPKTAIPGIVNWYEADLLVMAAHGHQAVKDVIFGTTLDAVRHSVKIPMLIVTKSQEKPSQ
jgi:manganese transport protein